MVEYYDLQARYDSRASFYGKASVEKLEISGVREYTLLSYGTRVAKVIFEKDKTIYQYYGKYSQTTTRHQREFFKQFGLNENELKELFKNDELIKYINLSE